MSTTTAPPRVGRKVVDTSLEKVLEIHEYFGNPANAPMLQMASDKTLYVCLISAERDRSARSA